jgi:sensor c-di-GMP phosphodiesterase-like protein
LVGSGLMKYLQRKEDVDPVAFCDFVANRPTPDFSGRTTNILAEVSNQFKVSQLQNWNPERMLREEIELRRNKIDKAERQLSQLEQASPEDAAKMLNYLIATRAIKDGYFVRESKDTKVNSSSEIEFAE